MDYYINEARPQVQGKGLRSRLPPDAYIAARSAAMDTALPETRSGAFVLGVK